MPEIVVKQVTRNIQVYQVGRRGPQGEDGEGIPIGGTTGQILRKVSGSNYDTEWADASGTGDMLAATYDPQNISDDSFARANHTGTQTASTISDFDTEVSNNTSVTAATNHISNTSNPHSVTKTQVGLGNVDNTSDANKPVSTAQATADNLRVLKAGDTMSGKLQVTSSASDHSIQLTPSGDAGSLSSSGGALFLNNTGNVGIGVGIYSNTNGTGSGNLLNVKADNAGFDQAAIYVDYDGVSNAVEVTNNTDDASANALSVTGNNTLDSAVGVIGKESGKGTVKVTHIKPAAADSSASGLSIDLQGTGTAAQGVYVDSTASGGTSGSLLRLRNQTVDQFVVTSSGGVTVGSGVSPITSDVGALGSATKMWADLFLASGAVINFNNGNFTLTHSSGLLTASSNIVVSSPGSVSGSVVTIDGTQTLTNKTLTSPAISTPTGIVKGDLGLGNVDNTSDVNKPVSTAQATAINAKVADSISDGITTIAPSQNAVIDALALKGDAFTSNPLSQFATTTSAQLAGVISNETGTGSLVFGTSPTLTSPLILKSVVTKVNTDSPYTILSTDDIVIANAASGAVTVTLPTAAGITGRQYIIKKIDSANTVTIATTSSQTIDGQLTRIVASQYDTTTVVSDGSNWIRI